MNSVELFQQMLNYFYENSTYVPLQLWDVVTIMIDWVSDLFDYTLVARDSDLTIWSEDVL